MNHCPYLTNDNRCQVASKMAECVVRASASGCEACQQDLNPQAVNLVTIGMALVERRRRHKPTDELKRMLDSYMPETQPPVSFKLGAYRPGPGSELRKMLSWFARPSDSCNCETRAETMNDWGASGCRTNVDTIVDWLLHGGSNRHSSTKR